MQKPDKTRTPARPSGSTPECCTELTCESGLRNQYFEGKRLTPDMFRVEQHYLNERRRLLNRAIHGWGVVYGYAIGIQQGKSGRKEQASTRLRIGAGLALDECGRELLHLERDVPMQELVALDAQGHRTDLTTLLTPSQYGTGREDTKKSCWLLSAHYAEQRTSHVVLKDACSCDRDEWDHVCETVRFSLRQVPCADCCAGWDCELTCACGEGKCCGEPDVAAPPAEHPKDKAYEQDRSVEKDNTDEHRPAVEKEKPDPPFRRGGCRCLCDHLTGLEFPGCNGRLCEIAEPCARVSVDIGQGVPLACLEIVPDDCGGWTIADVDACGPRRLVKRNDLLFDLVRGCDLTHIHDFGWKTWHRDTVSFADFAAGVAPDDKRQYEYVTASFWVTFSRPVRKATLDADCFSFTILSVEREGRWRGVQRVPVSRLEYIDGQPGDPAGHVRGAYLVVDGAWVEDGLWGRGSVFYEDTSVEIEVRGDYILDCNGQPVDANAVGRSTPRSGNGTPGGTFLSTFRIGPRTPYSKPAPPDTPPYPSKGAAS